MNYLQIWLNVTSDKPSAELKTHMRNVINFVGENDTYTLISNENLFPEIEKVIWVDSDKYIQEVIQNDLILKVWNYIDGKQDEFIYKSDIIRMYYLSQNENVFYIDCDVELKEVPELEDKFYLAQRGSQTNICLIYNGSDKETSMKILNEAIRVSYNIMEKDYRSIHMLWILHRLRNYNVSVIKDNYFVHHTELN